MVKGPEGKEIYQFAWSFDGKSLAYSTGARMQEIILLEKSRVNRPSFHPVISAFFFSRISRYNEPAYRKAREPS